MSNATLQVGGGNWAAQDGKLLGYAVEPTSGRYLAREFTVNRDSSKWVLGSDGYLYEVPADQPALEYYSDGTFRGALVESQSVNLCLQSENINVSWSTTGGNALPTQSTEATPDGDTSNKYIKLADDGAGGTGLVSVRQSINVLANTQYTASVFLKADGLSFAQFEIRNYDGATDGTQFFGLSGDGSLGAASNLDDSNIKAYPNGWYRCSVTWTQGVSSTSFTLYIRVANSISSTTVDRDGTSSIFVWGSQVEESPIATSYIPTTTGAVTRLKDDISFTNASSVIGQSEGTLFVEVDWRGESVQNQHLLEVSDGTASNRIIILNLVSTDELRMFAQSNGSIETSQGESSTVYSGIQKIAFAYKQNDCELYRNGSSISTDTTVDLSSLGTLTDVEFQQGSVGNNQANMWIRAVALFTTRLSDAEAYSLTGYDTYAQMANALQYTIL